jgi:hypothetical protein
MAAAEKKPAKSELVASRSTRRLDGPNEQNSHMQILSCPASQLTARMIYHPCKCAVAAVMDERFDIFNLFDLIIHTGTSTGYE